MHVAMPLAERLVYRAECIDDNSKLGAKRLRSVGRSEDLVECYHACQSGGTNDRLPSAVSLLNKGDTRRKAYLN